MLCFTSGPATVVEPLYIKHMDQPPGMMSGIKEVRLSEDHRIFLQGEFGNFRIYFLVTHTRAEIVPKSVQRISLTHFTSILRLELTPKTITEHEVVFRAPLFPYSTVEATCYGLVPDSFAFRGQGPGAEIFFCDLSFLLLQAENCPSIPLKVEYIGIAKSEKRGAQDRLGEGHDKLQMLLAEQNQRQSRQKTSIILYRPSELFPPVLSFPDVIETIEATMIQYFKPQPLNVARLNFPHDSPGLCAKIKAIGARSIITKVTAPTGTKLFSNSVPQQSEQHDILVRLE